MRKRISTLLLFLACVLGALVGALVGALRKRRGPCQYGW